MAALILATVLVPSETGLRVWLSDQLFQWVNAEISPVLLQTVTNAIDTLGDLEIAQQGGMFGSYNFTVGPITASEPGIGTVMLDLEPSVGLRFRLTGLLGEINADFEYANTNWPYVPSGSGTFVVALDPATEVDVVIGLNATDDGKPLAALNSIAVVVALGEFGFTDAWFANFFLVPVRVLVENLLEVTIEQAALQVFGGLEDSNPFDGYQTQTPVAELVSLAGVNATEALVALGYAPDALGLIDISVLAIATDAAKVQIDFKGEIIDPSGEKEQAALPPPNLEKVPADVLEVGVTSL